jgi:hypothetical protein
MLLHRLQHSRRALHGLQGTHPTIQGYLPNDTTGDVIFRIQEFIATILSAYILYCIQVTYRISYHKDLDSVKSYYLIALAFVLAVLFHSNLNRSLVGDFLWAFSQYL